MRNKELPPITTKNKTDILSDILEELYIYKFKKYKNFIINRYNLGDNATVNDIIQNSFEKLYKKIYENTDEFFKANTIEFIKKRVDSYLLKTIRTEIDKHFSLKRTNLEFNSILTDPSTNNTDEQVNYNELLYLIQDLIERKEDTDDKDILRMRILNDMEYKEISESLHIPIGTVKSKIYYLKKELINLITEKIK